MEAVKVIEKLLIRDCISREKSERYESCIVCASSMVWRISQLFPESCIVSNTASQILPNLASIYYSVKTLKVPLIAITGTTAVNLEEFIKLGFQAAEVEFKLLRKVYENNIDILLPLYEGNEKQLNAALMEINIDAQIDNLLSIPEFEDLVSKGKLYICGFVLDESGIYGDRTNFYLINFNGLKDPDEIRNHELLEDIPEAIRKQKVKRIHVQF
jgi:carbonic anhydrase